MSRPRTPTKVLEARGSFKRHPERKRHGEPEVTEALGKCPKGFMEDQEGAWCDIVNTAPEGVLTSADSILVEVAALLLAEFRESPVDFPAAKLTRLEAILGKFGLNPSERSRMSIAPVIEEVNPFDQFG